MIGRNHIVIHVGGYRPRMSSAVVIYGNGMALPDRLAPEPIYEQGSMDWYDNGWAVGDNSTGRYCKFGRSKPMMRFFSLDDALQYKSELTKKRAKLGEVFGLVYVEVGEGKKGSGTSYHSIRTQIDIDQIEKTITERKQAAEAQLQKRDDTFPCLDVIMKSGVRRALEISLTLAAYRQNGIEYAMIKCRISKQTALRRIKVLKDLGLITD